MTIAVDEGDGASEDGMDYLASLFQNADYKQIMQVSEMLKFSHNIGLLLSRLLQMPLFHVFLLYCF